MDNMNQADGTEIMADLEGKLKELLDKVIMESKKKGLITNCKQAECMLAGNWSYRFCGYKHKTSAPMHQGNVMIKDEREGQKSTGTV